MSRALMPNLLTPQDTEPYWKWEGRLPAWGHTSVELPGERRCIESTTPACPDLTRLAPDGRSP